MMGSVLKEDRLYVDICVAPFYSTLSLWMSALNHCSALHRSVGVGVSLRGRRDERQHQMLQFEHKAGEVQHIEYTGADFPNVGY